MEAEDGMEALSSAECEKRLRAGGVGILALSGVAVASTGSAAPASTTARGDGEVTVTPAAARGATTEQARARASPQH